MWVPQSLAIVLMPWSSGSKMTKLVKSEKTEVMLVSETMWWRRFCGLCAPEKSVTTLGILLRTTYEEVDQNFWLGITASCYIWPEKLALQQFAVFLLLHRDKISGCRSNNALHGSCVLRGLNSCWSHVCPISHSSQTAVSGCFRTWFCVGVTACYGSGFNPSIFIINYIEQ